MAIRTVVSEPVEITAGNMGSADAFGEYEEEQILGGGFQVSGGGREQTSIINNHPADGYYWHVTVKNNHGSQSVYLEAYAIVMEV